MSIGAVARCLSADETRRAHARKILATAMHAQHAGYIAAPIPGPTASQLSSAHCISRSNTMACRSFPRRPLAHAVGLALVAMWVAPGVGAQQLHVSDGLTHTASGTYTTTSDDA